MAQMGDHYFGLTDPGKVRDNNEDAFLVQEVPKTGQILGAVIDGVGGYEGGEVAAAIAKDSISELLKGPLQDVPNVLKESFFLANQRIIDEKQAHAGKEKMACVLTLVLADVAQNQFHYAHVGDTRMYLLRGESLIKVTKDHSFVGFLEDSSRITELDAMRHPKRNEVNKALGFDPNVSRQADYVETGSSPFLPGDTLLLCSDGLTDMVGAKEITDVLTGPGSFAAKAQKLIDAANSAGGRDNITVVLVHNYKERVEQQPMQPVSRATETPKTTDFSNAPINKVSEQRSRMPPIVWILLLACLGLSAALVWSFTRSKPTPAEVSDAPIVPPSVTHTLSPSQQQLMTRLNDSADSLVLDSSFASPVLISDSLVLNKDTFHFSGNGIVLHSGSSLNGPAIILPAATKYIVLENIVFENFPIAILANSNALRLVNVRFINCDIPVSYQLQVPEGSFVRGYIPTGLYLKTDSIPYKSKTW